MAGEITDSGTQYSTGIGLMFVFNLIVGTGALAMPKAFYEAGWLLSLITVIALAFMSYITVTFVLETMAIANAVVKMDRIQRKGPNVNEDKSYEESEESPLLNRNIIGTQPKSPFEITEKTELGQMASMFFNRVGLNLFYLCMAIYLYGDLSIYAAAVPKSVRDVACTYYPVPANHSDSCSNQTLVDDDPCWPGSDITRMGAYRIFVCGFFLLLGSFTFFNVQKTKYLQVTTAVFRWIAFGMMLVLTFLRLSKGEGQGRPAVADVGGMPNLFGVCVYSFMCHHSLPSLVTPIKNKSKLYSILAGDYTLILVFYALLSFSGIFAFSNIQDIYTLNFFSINCDDPRDITQVKFIEYFLALFPVFTLSTNFPIISITLRDNLKTIFYKENRPYHWVVDRIVFPLLALLPPFAISIATNHVEFLVGITGSYAGAGIQYIIPVMLVYFARKECAQRFSEPNIHQSPFRGKVWILFVFIWAGVCVIFVTINHIISGK